MMEEGYIVVITLNWRYLPLIDYNFPFRMQKFALPNENDCSRLNRIFTKKFEISSKLKGNFPFLEIICLNGFCYHLCNFNAILIEDIQTIWNYSEGLWYSRKSTPKDVLLR